MLNDAILKLTGAHQTDRSGEPTKWSEEEIYNLL